MTTENFFNWIFEPLKATHPDYNSMLLTTKLPGESKGLLEGTHTSPFDSAKIQAVIEKANKEGNNLYFSCGVAMEEHVMREGVLHYAKKDITGSTIVWTEIDGELTEDELNKIRTGELRPSICVSSGNGYHFYWLLNSFSSDNNNRIEQINRALVKKFNGDKACVDISRILRVPGTFNTKDPANPKPVKFLWYNHDAGGAPIRYSIDDLPMEEGSSSVDTSGREWVSEYLTEDFLLDKRFAAATWVKDKMMERLPAPSPGQPGKRSERDYKVASKMGELGFTEQEIYSCLTHPDWPIGDKGRENLGYAKRTAAKVTKSVDNFDSALAVLDRLFTPSEEKELTGSLPTINQKQLSKDIKRIFYEVLQPGGPGRPDRDHPKFGAAFGRDVAIAIHKAGFRYVFDLEFGHSFIADRRGRVWKAEEGGEEFGKFISAISDFASNQEEFRFISKGLISYIEQNGEQIRVGRWVHYDHESAKYYILADSKTGLMYIIDKDGKLTEGWNGEGDVFLRPRLQTSKPLKLRGDVPMKTSAEMLHKFFSRYIAGPDTTKRFLTALLISLTVCYGSGRVGTLPIVHLTGPSGGGKSATMSCMTTYLFGLNQLMLYTTAAAFRAAPSEIFFAHDDRENQRIAPEMVDFLLLCATKAKRSMCEQGSQVNVVNQQAHVVNGVTSIEQLPSVALRRRTLVVEINKDNFPSAEELMEGDIDDISENRDTMWSGMIPLFAEMINSHQNGRHRALTRKVYKYIEEGTFKGLSSFIAIMVLVDEQLAKAAGRPFDEEVTMQEFVATAGLDDKEQIIQRDPLVLCLESFFEKLFSIHVSSIQDIKSPEEQAEINFTNGQIKSFTQLLTDQDENDNIEKLIGCKVRGIKATSTGWISIFSTDTREFAKTIVSPTSLGVQFSRVEGKLDFPFYITSKRHSTGKIWSVFQKI